MTKTIKIIAACVLAAYSFCLTSLAEDPTAAAVIQHRNITPSVYVTTNAWETVKDKAVGSIGGTATNLSVTGLHTTGFVHEGLTFQVNSIAWLSGGSIVYGPFSVEYDSRPVWKDLGGTRTRQFAMLDDIPETAGIDITVLTVTNTEDRISFPSPDAKSIVGRANLISTDTKMTVTNSLLTIVKNGVVLWQEEDDGYYMFDKMTNLNHSVVTITSDFEHSSWDTVIPNAEEGELRDWIVTIFANEETSSTLSFGKFEEQGYALWASDGVLDAEDPSISTVEQGKAAMFYFTEIKAGLFVVGKANLSNAITPAPASEVQ